MAKAYDRDGGGGGYAGLRDIYLHHGINLTRYSTHEARKLQGVLDTANTQIKGIITKAKAVETKEKYYRISKEIRRITNQLTEKLDQQLELDFTELAGEETRFVEKAMRSVNVTADFDLPAPKKIWVAASFKPYGRKNYETFDSYYKKMGDDVYKVWDANVRAGYLAGLTAQQINRAVLGSVKDNIPGDMQKFRQSLERNTRTMVASMAEEARDATYKENSRLFSGYRYVGTLDSRTCLVCGELDGKVFKTLEEAPELPAHHNCRCLYLPEIKGLEGFDEDDERASADGPVPANMSYGDWLKTQTDDVVRDILGPTRFAMYKGGAEVSAFVTDGRTLSIKQLEAAEGTQEQPLRKENVFQTDTFDEITKYVKEEWGVEKTDFTGLDIEAVNGTFEAMDKVIKENPILKGQVKEIVLGDRGFMGTAPVEDGGYRIRFNPAYYNNIDTLKTEYENQLNNNGWFPAGTDWRNVGVHELGHVLQGIIAEKRAGIFGVMGKENRPDDDRGRFGKDWDFAETANRIVDKAWKVVEKGYPTGTSLEKAKKDISGYAALIHDETGRPLNEETLSEAFSDVFSNGENAGFFSREIVKLLLEEVLR